MERFNENGLDYCVCRTFILEYYEKKLGNFRGMFENISSLPNSYLKWLFQTVTAVSELQEKVAASKFYCSNLNHGEEK